MARDQRELEKEFAKIRVEKIAKLMVMPYWKAGGMDCRLREFLEKSFIERVLWLEDQTKFSLNNMIAQCEACGKCKIGNPDLES
jgi:malonyl CoA-acyl carrier protein transacylase